MMSMNIGYKTYVVSAKDAIVLAEMLARAEVYEKVFQSETKDYTHHIYEEDEKSDITLSVLPDSLYRMAKLAGRPSKD